MFTEENERLKAQLALLIPRLRILEDWASQKPGSRMYNVEYWRRISTMEEPKIWIMDSFQTSSVINEEDWAFVTTPEDLAMLLESKDINRKREEFAKLKKELAEIDKRTKEDE